MWLQKSQFDNPGPRRRTKLRLAKRGQLMVSVPDNTHGEAPLAQMTGWHLTVQTSPNAKNENNHELGNANS